MNIIKWLSVSWSIKISLSLNMAWKVLHDQKNCDYSCHFICSIFPYTFLLQLCQTTDGLPSVPRLFSPLSIMLLSSPEMLFHLFAKLSPIYLSWFDLNYFLAASPNSTCDPIEYCLLFHYRIFIFCCFIGCEVIKGKQMYLINFCIAYIVLPWWKAWYFWMYYNLLNVDFN